MDRLGNLGQAGLAAALSLTMIIQGFVSVYVGVREARSLVDLGIGGLVAGVLLAQGAAWAFAAGILACLLVYGKNFFRGDVEAAPLWADQMKEVAMTEDK